MLKFQTPMLNDDVCRAMTDKQTHKQTYILSKNWEFFFTAKFFFYFYFSNILNVKRWFPIFQDISGMSLLAFQLQPKI